MEADEIYKHIPDDDLAVLGGIFAIGNQQYRIIKVTEELKDDKMYKIYFFAPYFHKDDDPKLEYLFRIFDVPIYADLTCVHPQSKYRRLNRIKSYFNKKLSSYINEILY